MRVGKLTCVIAVTGFVIASIAAVITIVAMVREGTPISEIERQPFLWMLITGAMSLLFISSYRKNK